MSRSVYAVDVALDARLFGRFRLLTIDATIDVVEPTPGSRSNGNSALRRSEVEALLGDAERQLASNR